MANFSPTCPIDLSGPPSEVHCPEYSWWIEPKQTFPYCYKSLEVLEVSCPLILNLCMHCVFSGFDIWLWIGAVCMEWSAVIIRPKKVCLCTGAAALWRTFYTTWKRFWPNFPLWQIWQLQWPSGQQSFIWKTIMDIVCKTPWKGRDNIVPWEIPWLARSNQDYQNERTS